MLRVSRLTDYATLVLSMMARAPAEIHSASELADQAGLGLPTVSKVLKLLARGGIVIGARGLHGGYALARDASLITVADIVDALEDRPFGLTDCSANEGSCRMEDDCGIRAGWQTVSSIVRQALEAVTLADMVLPRASDRKQALGAGQQRARSTEHPLRFVPDA